MQLATNPENPGIGQRRHRFVSCSDTAQGRGPVVSDQRGKGKGEAARLAWAEAERGGEGRVGGPS